MKYKKTDTLAFLRFEKGDEIISKLKEFCESESIYAGSFSAVGALSGIELGFFNPIEKKYSSKVLGRPFELVSFTGNISQMNGKPYIHAHATVSDENLNSFSGHASMATISVTGEMIICFDGTLVIDRFFDPEVGLNLMGI